MTQPLYALPSEYQLTQPIVLTTLKYWFSIYCSRICICMLDAATITVNFHSFNNVYKSIIYVCQTFLLITAVLSKVCPAGSKKDILYTPAAQHRHHPFLAPISGYTKYSSASQVSTWSCIIQLSKSDIDVSGIWPFELPIHGVLSSGKAALRHTQSTQRSSEVAVYLPLLPTSASSSSQSLWRPFCGTILNALRSQSENHPSSPAHYIPLLLWVLQWYLFRKTSFTCKFSPYSGPAEISCMTTLPL